MMVCDRSPGQGPYQSPGLAWRSAAPLCQRPPGAGLPSRCGTPRLAGLHRVHAMTARPLATTPPPSSLPHTGLFVSDDVGEALGEFPRARTTDRQQPVAASSTPGARGDNAAQRSDLRSPAPAHVGSGVSQPLAPRRHHDASDSGASRQQRSQDASGLPRVAHRSRPVMNRLQPPGVANP